MNKQIKYYDLLVSSRSFQKFLFVLFDIILKSIRYFTKLIPLERKGICVISLHKLGDSIFTFDAINSIKNFYGENVFIICNEDSLPIYELIHKREYLIPIPKKYFHFGDRYSDSRARKLLRSLKPKIIIDLTGVMTSASLIFNSRAKTIIGFNRRIFKGIYNNFKEFQLGNHSKEIYTNAIKEIIPIRKFEGYIQSKVNSDRILIAPFAGWISKEWSIVKFIELAERLKDNFNICLIFDDRRFNEKVIKYLNDKKINYVKISSVSDLINEIRDCRLLIGNDSGPVQIAAILGKYTFSIYGPTNPKFHLPEGEKHFFIQKTLPCSPKGHERLCFTDGGKDGCPAFECMNNLIVDEVYEKSIQIIKSLN
ncbi:ADP-heptose:LPS heptosyltransferase [Ignavibacterium album JCM 16511]|uniref:ADP-heptose:LPS heptosyltransferase n=1 Tax=Ignavibacterium album (strain DSM 19864 / JCM 16511 / NBRC 101810 / Mat9-16) TaxID=945713 RepID=I0ALC9_IGNAJ|nr:glycosyltransferase family 9 protein [Ignavibacterium album]AFH49786.1 ADP-heptose:LPS heptosyltransferase [Ignavibacterium album JCM 16511]